MSQNPPRKVCACHLPLNGRLEAVSRICQRLSSDRNTTHLLIGGFNLKDGDPDPHFADYLASAKLTNLDRDVLRTRPTLWIWFMGHVAFYDPELVKGSPELLASLVARHRLRGYPVAEGDGVEMCLACKIESNVCTRSCRACGGNICDFCCQNIGETVPRQSDDRFANPLHIEYLTIDCPLCGQSQTITFPICTDEKQEPIQD